MGATLGLGLVALPLLGYGIEVLIIVAVSGLLAVMVARYLSMYVDYVDVIKPLYTVFTLGLLLYDIPAALGYLKAFAELTLGLPTVLGYIVAGVVAYIAIFMPDRLFHWIKAIVVAVTIPLLIVYGTPLKPGSSWLDIIGLTVFAYVGFSLPLRRARTYNEGRNAFAVGVAMGYAVITVLYVALVLLGVNGFIVYGRERATCIMVGMLGLTAYVGFLKGIMGQLAVKYGVVKAAVIVALANVVIPLTIVVTGLPIEKYLAYAGLLGGAIQYLVGLYLLAGRRKYYILSFTSRSQEVRT